MKELKEIFLAEGTREYILENYPDLFNTYEKCVEDDIYPFITNLDYPFTMDTVVLALEYTQMAFKHNRKSFN